MKHSQASRGAGEQEGRGEKSSPFLPFSLSPLLTSNTKRINTAWGEL
jgi:hypothetical protein